MVCHLVALWVELKVNQLDGLTVVMRVVCLAEALAKKQAAEKAEK